MSGGYTPRPGSVADRALAHLAHLPAGLEISTGQLAEAIGAEPGSLSTFMQSALEHHAVAARQKGGHPRSPRFWSLPGRAARNAWTGEASSPANGSQTPDDGRNGATVEAGSNTPRRAAQHVLKAEAARPDATDRAEPATRSPVGGPMGARQPAAAGPAGGVRIALWSDGTLQIERATIAGAADLVLFSADETRALVRYLDHIVIPEETTS